MITLYNSCVRKFIYLQNFQTFTIYRNSSCSYPWKKVWWYTSINQSPCYSSQYKRVLEDTDCGKRYRNKTPCICTSKAQWPIGINQAFWDNLCIFYHWDTKVNSLDFWCLVFMQIFIQKSKAHLKPIYEAQNKLKWPQLRLKS